MPKYDVYIENVLAYELAQDFADVFYRNEQGCSIVETTNTWEGCVSRGVALTTFLPTSEEFRLFGFVSRALAHAGEETALVVTTLSDGSHTPVAVHANAFVNDAFSWPLDEGKTTPPHGDPLAAALRTASHLGGKLGG